MDWRLAASGSLRRTACRGAGEDDGKGDTDAAATDNRDGCPLRRGIGIGLLSSNKPWDYEKRREGGAIVAFALRTCVHRFTLPRIFRKPLGCEFYNQATGSHASTPRRPYCLDHRRIARPRPRHRRALRRRRAQSAMRSILRKPARARNCLPASAPPPSMSATRRRLQAAMHVGSAPTRPP